MEELECVVVGAGWYGLAAAKQYHVQHPEQPMAVFESASTIGGVWAEHRLYPGLRSNNLLGTYEYPDFPMDPAVFGVQPGQHIPARVVHDYLEAYARRFGVYDLVRFRTEIVSAEHQPGGGWILGVEDADSAAPQHVFAKRLIVATGLASQPFTPRFDGQDAFEAPLFHARDFALHADTVDPARTRRATVLGGSKSAWDAVYAYGRRGVQVDWVIRASGHGACWIAPPYVTPFKKWLEKLANMRFLTWFSPCTWADDSGYSAIQRFWHATAVGRAITRKFWDVLAADVISLCGFDAHPQTAKLKPWTDAFATGTSFSILNYETDFFALVRDGTVRVHVADIDRLGPRSVHLADESRTVLESDAFLCATGWNHVPPLRFLPEGLDRELGLPHPPAAKPDPGDLASRRDLFDRADAEILTRFPALGRAAVFNKNYVPLSAGQDNTSSLTPMLLHRFLVPPQPRFLVSRDVAFTGFSDNFSNAITAHISGLWISAFFDGRLARDPGDVVLADLQYQTVLHNRTGKWRYPTDYADRHPTFIFDAVPYMDTLMADLGLRVHRKRGWFREATEPYGPEDYRDINQEWRARSQDSRRS